jgi:hypothetical protein
MRDDLTREILSESLIQRLASKVDRRSTNECWPFAGCRMPQGYGRLSVNFGHGVEYAHRIAFMLANDEDIPAGMVVMHTCDNPPCCNPSHLRVATQSENCLDRDRKGRRSKKITRPPAYKLTDEESREAGRLYESGWMASEVSVCFDVSVPLVLRAIRRVGFKVRTPQETRGLRKIA